MQQTSKSRVFRASWSHPNAWPNVVAFVVGGIFSFVGFLILISVLKNLVSTEGGLFGSMMTLAMSGVVGGVGVFVFVVAVVRIRKSLSYSVRVDKDGITIIHRDKEKFIGMDQVERCRHERCGASDGYQYLLYVVHSEGEEQIDADALAMGFADIKHFDELVALHSSGRYRSRACSLSADELEAPSFIKSRIVENAFYADQAGSGECS